MKFYSDFFWVRDFGKDFFGVVKKRNPGFSFLLVCQTIILYHDAKTVWNSLELLLLFFLILLDFFGVTFWAVRLFLGQGLA